MVVLLYGLVGVCVLVAALAAWGADREARNRED